MRTEPSMSHRKKRSSEVYLSSTLTEVRDPSESDSPTPNPPRPNKPLLIASTVLLAAWIAFLIVLAIVS